MVVVAIIVLLAGIMVPLFGRRIDHARMIRAETDIAMIETALSMYEMDLGAYPPGTGDITLLKRWLTGVGVSIPHGSAWAGPYIKGIPNDPWGSPYRYYQNTRRGNPHPGSDRPLAGHGSPIGPPDNLHYYIYSMGRNRMTGINHNKDDINNWDIDQSWRKVY